MSDLIAEVGALISNPLGSSSAPAFGTRERAGHAPGK
jgi:hypothetical protein